MQEGYIGLMKAAEKFDTTMDIQFSTYAIWWIRSAISRSVKKIPDDISILSLDKPLNTEDGSEVTLMDAIPDGSESIEDRTERVLIKEQIHKVIEEKLTPEEQDIIKKKYGFNGKCYTGEDIAIQHNISTEKVHRVARNALFKLRRTRTIKELEEEKHIDLITNFHRKGHSTVEDVVLFRERRRERIKDLQTVDLLYGNMF